MQTVVLAAGEGTRMRPLTATRPKPVLPVAGKPLLAHGLERASAAGASRFVVVVGYRGAAVRDAVGEEFAGVPVEYVEQERQRGTADAVAAAREYLDDAPFAVLNGDNLHDPAGLARVYDEAPAVAVRRVPDPRSYGVVRVDGGTGRVRDVVEKPADPPSDLANAGAYAFPAAAREWLDVDASERGERELTDVLRRVCERQSVTPVTLDSWLDVGRPWELLAANERELARLDRRIDGDVSEDATVTGDVVVEAGATVREGVTVEGPALIAEGATVGPNAYVRGPALLQPGAHVGHAVEVKNSVLMRDATAGHLSYVGDSVVGREANLGAGTVVANLRHDEASVRMRVKGEPVDTGRRKLGAVLGDGAKTGVNTSLDPGVRLGADAHTHPGETLAEDRGCES